MAKIDVSKFKAMKQYLSVALAAAVGVIFSSFFEIDKTKKFDIVTISFLGTYEGDFLNVAMWDIGTPNILCTEEIETPIVCVMEIDESSDPSNIHFIDGYNVIDFLLENNITTYEQLKSTDGISIIGEKERIE